MVSRQDANKARQKRHKRVRGKISGTAECPRLNVYRSLSNIYVQLIDDVAGVTLAQASTVEKDFTQYGGNVEAAKAVGKTIADRAKAKGIEKCVFDRGGYLYTGRVAQVAEGARKAGLESLPAYIREVDDENLHAMALVENIQREDLNAIEIALGMQRLIDECNLTQEALSEKVGKKRSTVSNYMRLLKLPNEVQLALKEGLISMGHAKAIAGAPEELQLRLLKKCIRKGLSVRQIEELVRALTDPAAKPAAPAEDEEYPESYARLVEQLEKFFSQEISIKRSKNGGGRIVIDFSDDRDIDRFIEKFEKRGASAEIRNNK